MKSRGVLTAMAMLAVLAGCSDSSPSAEELSEPASTSTEPTPSASPEFVERDDCRLQMETVSQIVDSMERDSLGFSTFEGQVQRIKRLQRRAETTCSNKVTLPLSMALYDWSLASFYWELCPGSKCDTDKITDQVAKGIREGAKAVTRADATA